MSEQNPEQVIDQLSDADEELAEQDDLRVALPYEEQDEQDG